MSSTTYFIMQDEGVHKTTITEYTKRKESYGVLALEQFGGKAELRIFLNDKKITRKLLNAVKRIDRRLNPCQKQ